MNQNQKNFNLYIFLSTFSRNLIETFIPIILYSYGYSLKEVIFYFLLTNVFSLILTYPFVSFSKKYNNRILAIIGATAFVVVQILLNFIDYNIFYLILIAFIYSIYRRGYWISRRYYNLKIIGKDKISSTYSFISILNQVGVVVSSYVGSLFLDFISIKTLTIISIILYFTSVFPLWLLKFQHEKNDIKLDLVKTIKQIPKRNLYLFGSYELSNVLKFLFTMYLFIYVKNNYHTIGLLNLVSNVAIILFTYLYGKKIDGKKNFIKLSILLVCFISIVKANSTSFLLIFISFLEGIFNKMYELSIHKEFYVMSKKFEYYNYNLIYEMIQNFSRSFIVLLLLIFIKDLKVMIYIVIIFILLGILIDFKHLKKRSFKI